MMREKRISPPLIGLLAALWMIGVLAAYYWYHKPFTPELAVHLLGLGGQVAVSLAVIGLAGGLGARLAPLAGDPPLVRMALQAGLGLGLLGVVYLVLGAAIGTAAWLGWLLLFLPAILLNRNVWGWFRQATGLVRLYRGGGGLGRLLAWGIGAVLLLALLTALAPPLKFDSLVYHLGLPRAYLAMGQVRFVPGNMYWGMPQTGEMLYTWAIALAGTKTFAVLGWAFGVLTLIGLAGFIESRISARGAWVGCAALVSGFSLASALSWGYIDWLVMLFGIGVFVRLESWSRGRRSKDLVLAGIFAGFALGTKYTAGVVALAGIALIVLEGFFGPVNAPRTLEISDPDDGSAPAPGNERGRPDTKSRFPGILRSGIVFGLTLTLTSLPWWLKNLLATGNPFYPFVFATETMSAFRLQFYQGLPPWGGWENALLLPWQATITGVEAAAGFGVSAGPLLLALGGLSGIGWRRRRGDQQQLLRNAWLFCLAGWIVWALAGRLSGLLIQTRLYLGLFPVLAILAAAGFEALERFQWPGVRLGRIAAIAVLVVFGLNLFELTGQAVRREVPGYLFNQVADSDYLAQNLGMYALAMEAVDGLPEGARVKMLWEPRGAYCLPVCEPDEILDAWITTIREHGYDVDAVQEAWRRDSFTHLLYYASGREFYAQDDRYLPQDWQTLDDLLPQLETVADLNGIYLLYRLP